MSAMILTAGSLPEDNITQLRQDLQTHRWWSGSSCMSAPAWHHVHLCTYDRHFRPANMQSSISRMPVSHTTMRRMLVFRTSCHGLPVGLGSDVARADRLCMLCGHCPGHELQHRAEVRGFLGHER